MSQYDAYINETADKYGVRRDIAHRLVKNESGGNQNAVSEKGAIGITQLLPGTAKELGVDPTDPYQNIEGGLRYLKKGLDKFGGDYSQAVAGYHAGPNNKGVITKNWDMLGPKTKQYVGKFADLLISPASANETPYHAPTDVIDLTDATPFKAEAKKSISSKSDVIDLSNATPWTEQKQTEPSMSLGESIRQSEQNFVPSTLNLVGNTAKAIWNAPETTESIVRVAGGTLERILPDNMLPDWAQGNKDASKAFTDYYVNKYGGWDNVKQAMATDPMSVIADASVALGGGKALLNTAPAKAAVNIADKTLGVSKFRNKALTNTIGDVHTNIPTQSLNKVGTLSVDNTLGPREALDQARAQSAVNTEAAYNTSTDITQKALFQIRPTTSTDAISKVLLEDRTALNQIKKNNAATGTVNKILNKGQLSATEAVDLHKKIGQIYRNVETRKTITPETVSALKDAQTAISTDLRTSGNHEVADALDTARITAAKESSVKSLADIYEKHLTPDGTTYDFPALDKSLRSWTMSAKGKKVIANNPGLKEDINRFRESISTYKPELKSYLNEPAPTSILGNLVGNSIPNVLAKNVGGIVGSAIGGPAGAMIGEGVQLAGRGAIAGTKGLTKKVLQSGLYEPKFRAKLQEKLTPTPLPVVPKVSPQWTTPDFKVNPSPVDVSKFIQSRAMPPADMSQFIQSRGISDAIPAVPPADMSQFMSTRGVSDITPSTSIASPVGFTGPGQPVPPGMNRPIPAGPSSYIPLGLPAPNPLRTVRPGNIDVLPTDVVNKILGTSKIESIIKPVTSKVEMKPKPKRVKKEMKPKK